MAHVKLLASPSRYARASYMVDASVGKGGHNRSDDVFLVQFFLNALWGVPVEGETFRSGAAAPAIDGHCGPRTVEAIVGFQKYYWGEKQARFADGKVEPLPPNTFLGPRHQNPYTIIGLNANFGVAFGVERHAQIWKEPNFPAAIAKKFFVMN